MGYKTIWVITSSSQTAREICALLEILPEKSYDKGTPVLPPDSGSTLHPFTTVFFGSQTWPTPIPSAHELEEVAFTMQEQKDKLAKLAAPFRLQLECIAPVGETNIPLSAELITALSTLNASMSIRTTHTRCDVPPHASTSAAHSTNCRKTSD